MRGRGRKGPNPLTRTFESNGPDVKIRGTAMHIAEKYQQLARDAHASGDRVMSENYNQHAEHYLRIVAAAQPPQQAAQSSARGEADEGFDNTAPVNGSAANNGNGAERPPAPERTSSAADEDLVDADSPQPFIEDMPLIDPEGQVNGTGQKAGADETAGEEKPRRRARVPRARTPRRTAASSSEAAPQTAASPREAEAPGGEEPAKPQRRPARARRAKVADEVSSEASSAGEMTPGE
ncbi:DUF4167 domain-containing protein [Labrenzia sp. 011]|uniref:DUF4167 domain-containing protein n=1 Tax=Labrenzia sp. 011 TaxID=2171494 RepID=UPI000D516FF1|nr:DUF4167 domain-containing protein [Labrenzia sp. 011]PVB61564.1 DUF4167 domain-containing protein [Labrenzia sp. 011]